MNNEATIQSESFAPAIPQSRAGGDTSITGVTNISSIPSAVSIIPNASRMHATNNESQPNHNKTPTVQVHNHLQQEDNRTLEDMVEENPHFRLMQERLQNDMEVMKEISHVLQSLFAGGADQHLEADERLAIINDVFALAAKYQHQKASNPNITISTLTSQIGSGSAFYQKASEFIISQHPENDEDHPEHSKNKKHTKPDNHHWLHLPHHVQHLFHHGQEKPMLHVSANDSDYHGTIDQQPQMEHTNHN